MKILRQIGHPICGNDHRTRALNPLRYIPPSLKQIFMPPYALSAHYLVRFYYGMIKKFSCNFLDFQYNTSDKKDPSVV